MATKDDFSTDDWAALVRAPMLAGLAISLADPGGPIELTKESVATMKTVLEPVGAQETPLITALRADFAADVNAHDNPVKGFKPSGPPDILDELRRVAAIVAAAASPEESQGFRDLVYAAAVHAGEAAKEGGFLGMGGEQVSDRERSMLEQIDGALAPPVA